MKKILYFGTIILLLFSACRKPERYSDIPEIKFISFEKLNSTDGILTFYFQDGDGDIGINNDELYPPFDSTSVYHNNFFCDYYEKQNGIFVKIDSVEFNGKMRLLDMNARIPRLSNLKEESINGEIYLAMIPYREPTPFDTIKLTFYIVDRKLNHSNIEEVVVIR